MGNRLYSSSHQWFNVKGDIVSIGITDFLQDKLGGIMFVNLPENGTVISRGESFGDIESKKTVFDLVSEIGGTVIAVNEELFDNPNLINHAPYDSWLIKVETKDMDTTVFMDEVQYSQHIDKPWAQKH